MPQPDLLSRPARKLYFVILIRTSRLCCRSSTPISGLATTKYQAEIDRYLVACKGPKFQHLILPRGKAPHYDNLPDFSFYALSILDPSKDNIPELQQIFLLLRQCTSLRRRTKRAQRELQWEAHSQNGIHHLIQSMQGTLLGLYPSCARSVAFVTRVHIYSFIHSLLVVDFPVLNQYLQKIRYILKI